MRTYYDIRLNDRAISKRELEGEVLGHGLKRGG